MRAARGKVLAALLPGAALALWLLAGWFFLRATLDPEQRNALDAVLAPLVPSHGILPFAWWLAGAVGCAWLAARLYERYVHVPARLAEAAQTLASSDDALDLGWDEPAPAAAVMLAASVAQLAAQRHTLRADVAEQVEAASRSVAQERDRLGALMAELQQSVVVCNLDGRILLYNARARHLFRHLGEASGAVADPIGLGRSIHAVIERPLVEHALQTVRRRIARRRLPALIAARLVTTAGDGRLLQVSLAPVRASDQTGELVGYVLLLDDFTDEYRSHSRRDRQLLELTESSRAAVGSIQAALDMLDYPDLDAETRARFSGVVRDELAGMSERLAELAESTSQEVMGRWPVQEMLGADLLEAARQRIEADTGCTVGVSEIDETVWLSVDSFALIQVLAFLGARLVDEFGLRSLQLRLARAQNRAQLDIVWAGHAANTETIIGWQIEPMRTDAEDSPLSVREVIERHDGEIWFQRERTRQLAFFRLLLPLAGEPGGLAELDAAQLDDAAAWSRPEFYDFDLFAASEGSRELDDQSLANLAYTVFDTETTGLDPSHGDEIIQIGAVRIVNGRLLRTEVYEQLVDPGRSIPAESIPIHGIRPEMVRGRPRISEVLPVFHDFVGDTVLVGHNAAFDMRFLQIQAEKGCPAFEQPVLDTLLLSAIVYPSADSHSLEAICARLGVTVEDRHTAMGDALVTAEMFLRLLPMLRRQGIVTLGQVRAAAQKTYYARLKY